MPLYKPPNVNTPVLSQFSLQGKTAVVTGGAKGIGLEVVRGLAEAGADVALLYGTSAAAAADAARTIAAANPGVRISPYACDVSSRADVTRVFDLIEAEFCRNKVKNTEAETKPTSTTTIDIVVANAGVCASVPALDYTEAEWAANNGVNLDGVMWTAQAAGRVFRRQGRGSLIITASVSATLVNVPQRQAAYNASKAAAVHLGRCLAVEWADFARVNCISPGFIMTEMLTKQPKVGGILLLSSFFSSLSFLFLSLSVTLFLLLFFLFLSFFLPACLSPPPSALLTFSHVLTLPTGAIRRLDEHDPRRKNMRRRRVEERKYIPSLPPPPPGATIKLDDVRYVPIHPADDRRCLSRHMSSSPPTHVAT